MDEDEIKNTVPFLQGSNNVEDGEKKNHIDAIQKAIGAIGKYQIYLCLVIFITKLPVAFHQMSIIFLAPPVSYVCNSTNITNGCPCSDPIYDISVFQDTIIMSWDLICERSSLKDLAQTVVMLGILIGSVVFGSVSDRFGRRLPFIACVVIQLGFGVAASQAPEFWSFCFFRFIVGAATGGTMVISFVLTMEFMSKEYREPVSALYQLPFNFGHLMLAGLGYFFRDWSTLQLTLMVPSVLMLSYYWLVPESPRWLLAVGETEKAIAVLEKAAKRNNLPTETIARDITNYQNTKTTEQMQKGTLLDLFRTPNLRKNTICMAVGWLVCGFGYFGVSQYIGKLAGDIFVNVAISATVTIPGTLLSIPLMKKMGRKTLVVASFALTSVCLFLIAIIDSDLGKVILACIGDVGMFIAFIVIYLYASELFPTVVRNAGIGLCSMLARVGSMVAPYIAGLGTQIEWLPPVIFGVVPVIGAGLCLLMPETKGSHLLNTIEEGENFGKKKPSKAQEMKEMKS